MDTGREGVDTGREDRDTGLKHVCLSVGVGRSDLHSGEGLPDITLSDRTGWLPDC